MSSHNDRSISVLSPCACQQSVTNRLDYKSESPLVTRPTAVAAELRPPGSQFGDLLRDKSSPFFFFFRNVVVNLLKIWKSFLIIRFALGVRAKTTNAWTQSFRLECQVGCCIKCFCLRNFSHRIRGWGVAHSASLLPGDALCISNLFSMWCLCLFLFVPTLSSCLML